MAIIKTDALNKIFHEMNNFDNNLKFILETMNPALPFLDTEIYLDTNNELQHRFYRKKVASTKLHNYKTAVIPWKYINSILCGEIYRHYNTCSNETDLKIALQDLKIQFLKKFILRNISLFIFLKKNF